MSTRILQPLASVMAHRIFVERETLDRLNVILPLPPIDLHALTAKALIGRRSEINDVSDRRNSLVGNQIDYVFP